MEPNLLCQYVFRALYLIKHRNNFTFSLAEYLHARAVSCYVVSISFQGRVVVY